MNKLFIVAVLCYTVFGWTSVYANAPPNVQVRVPTGWYRLPEDAGSSINSVRADIVPDDILPQALDKIYQINQDAMEEVVDVKPSFAINENRPKNWVPWHLDAFTTDLTIDLQGLFGVLTVRGMPAVSAIWRRKENLRTNLSISSPQDEESQPIGMTLSEGATPPDLERQLEPTYQAVLATGKIKDTSALRQNLKRTMESFRGLVQSIGSRDESAWWLSTMRIDFVVLANGKVMPASLSVGGEVRVRLEWKRNQRAKPQSAVRMAKSNTLSRYQPSLIQLVQLMERDLENASSQTLGKEGFRPYMFRVGIGMTAQGDLGLAKGAVTVMGHLHFNRDINRPASQSPRLSAGNQSVMIIDNAPTANHLKYAKEQGIPVKVSSIQTRNSTQQAVYQVVETQWVKGIKKAMDMGSYFANRPVNPKKNWQLYEIRTSFELSLGGDVGLVVLLGVPTTQICFRKGDK